MFEIDELKLYRGRDIQINKNIVVSQPILNQIEEFGEKKYFNAIHTLTSVGADLKWQLWDIGIDYTKIEDYDLFIKLISQIVSSKKRLYIELTTHSDKYKNELENLSEEDLEDMLVNPLSLILKYKEDLKPIDLDDFRLCKLQKNNQIVLYNNERDVTIDRLAYSKIVDVVRKIHGLKRNNQIPANERTKMDLIEDARDEAIIASRKPYKSILRSLISSLSVKCGQCGDERIWNMPIGMLFDNVKRANKIQDSQLLLQGAYSGFASLKGIDKTRLDWTGDI